MNPRVLLDYSSVLIRPRVTSLSSRSQVSLIRHIPRFLHSPREWSGIPIMVANMDTTGTMNVHSCTWDSNIITILHKHYSSDEIKGYFHSSTPESHTFLGISTGINQKEYECLVNLKQDNYSPTFITIDVANGYMECLIEFTRRVRDLFPDSIIIAGNVVCGERTK